MHDPYGLGNPNSGSNHSGGGFGPPPQQGYIGPSHQPHGQPSYGQPSYGQQPGYPPPPPNSQGAYVSYGQGAAPPNVYAPPVNVQTNELQKLEDDSQLWLLVAAVGFWVGFGWVTGPLAWYFGSQLRGKYRALGHHPCASANWAWGIGIISTAIYALGMMLLIFGILALVGALAL
jgi:hypothetical protein